MQKDFFVELLNKYLRGEANEREESFLLSYYEAFSDDPDVVKLMTDDERNNIQNEISSRIWADIEKTDARTRALGFGWYRIAAAAVIVIASVFAVYFMFPDGKDQGAMSYKVPAPREHRFLRLPDGTTVIVSAGSKLNYPSSFDGMDKREIYLEGQAYFDVKHNPSKPFVIHTGGVATTVLGTAFNIDAWPSSGNVTVTVTRGKVRVDENDRALGTINPNEQITYNTESRNTTLKNVDAEQVMTWKDQDLLMNNVTVGEAAEVLQTRYDVSIKIDDDQFRNSRFTTTFKKDETLEQVLRSICEFSNAKYLYNSDLKSVVLSVK